MHTVSRGSGVAGKAGGVMGLKGRLPRMTCRDCGKDVAKLTTRGENACPRAHRCPHGVMCPPLRSFGGCKDCKAPAPAPAPEVA